MMKRSNHLDKVTGCCKGGKCKPGQSSSSNSMYNYSISGSLLGKRVHPSENIDALHNEVQLNKYQEGATIDNFGGLD